MACNTEIKRRANQKKENPQTEARIWEASRALKGNKFKNLAQAACHYACDKKLQKGVKHAVLLARKNKIGKNCHKIDSMQSFHGYNELLKLQKIKGAFCIGMGTIVADPTSAPYPDGIADAHYQHDPADAPYPDGTADAHYQHDPADAPYPDDSADAPCPDAHAHIDSPSSPEGELVGTDAMIVDDDYDPFPSYSMMDEDEDFPEWDYRLHLGDDEDVIFNIPEQILQRDEVDDLGSNSSLGSNSRLPGYQTEDEELSSESDQVDHQDQNGSFAEPIDHQVATFLM
ncbi:hypothetical protein V8E53_012268 [Lactarius tabidus]